MKRKYEIERPQPGVLSYREGGTEFQFPVYDEDGEVVFVAWPTSQRIFLFFRFGGWTRVPRQFSTRDRERIVSRVVEHFHREGVPVRVLARGNTDEQGFQFHGELFEWKRKASEILDAAGFVWLSDYTSIDLLHEEYGLVICGIQDGSKVDPIAELMRRGVPHWHYSYVCRKGDREPGWQFALHMFPRRCEGGECADGD
jgi:hypothetical protein